MSEETNSPLSDKVIDLTRKCLALADSNLVNGGWLVLLNPTSHLGITG